MWYNQNQSDWIELRYRIFSLSLNAHCRVSLPCQYNYNGISHDVMMIMMSWWCHLYYSTVQLLSHRKFVCLHFKLIVSQSFILVVKNLSQVRMFSRKLSTIYSRTVNCPQNWKDFYAGIFWFVWKKLFLASLSILSIKIKLNSLENIQM